MLKLATLFAALLMLSACAVVTAPVKVVGKVVKTTVDVAVDVVS